MTWHGPLLDVVGLTRRYGDLTALDDVHLQIYPGQVVALLGPNGAGKTTLIGCVTGLVARFQGVIRVAGLDVTRDYRAARRLVGLVPQELNYDAFFNVMDVLCFQGGYFGLRPAQARQRALDLLDAFALADKAKANTRNLSGGMKRRLMICKALMHDPPLLFLDEPTAGVDVELREELWRYVAALRERGTTIVLTTHYLEEAERLADRIGVLHRGRLRGVHSREALLRAQGQRQLSLRLAQPAPPIMRDPALPWRVDARDPRQISMTYREGDDALGALWAALARHALWPQLVEGRRASLEEIFRELIAQADREDAAATAAQDDALASSTPPSPEAPR